MRYSVKFVLAAALLFSAGMWLYVDRVLVRHQKLDAAIRGAPRGNLSDLYPSWLASRELLLHRRNPYTPEITREIQAGYYGRAIDPARTEDPANQQAFAYPVFVVFLLALTVRLPFSEVQEISRWLLAGTTVVSVILWFRVLKWSPQKTTVLIVIVLTLGAFAAVQGIKLQQLTLLTAALIAGSVALLISGQLTWAGILLALAMIKPQLATPLAAWLLVWSTADWRMRWKLAASFILAVGTLVLGGEILLPGWTREFYRAMLAYRTYAAGPSILQAMATRAIGGILSAFVIIAITVACWRARKCAAADFRFRWTVSMVLATTLLVIPVFAPHYQLLLLPAALMVVQRWRELWASSFVHRVLLGIAAGSIVWPWISACALAAASWFTPLAQQFWQLPLWTSVFIPIPLSACLWLFAFKHGNGAWISAVNRPTSSSTGSQN